MPIDVNGIEAGAIIRTRDGNRARVLRPSEDGAFLPVEYLHDGSSDVCGADEIMSVVAPDNDTRDVLKEVLAMMDEIAELLRSLGNARINAYCLAAFEGGGGGWLGQFERDIIEQELRSLDDAEGEE
ncbi:MAG: hypothetical protein WEB52_02815 [Dehalococcoidia bacterium]